jgi:G3E family GTPase
VTLTTLVIGDGADRREAVIAAAVDAPATTAVILEGIPSGKSLLEAFTAQGMPVVRIAPACMCCTGNLTMRVTLNRLLRNKPARLYIGLASATHLPAIRSFLQSPPYADLLQLAPDVCV